MKLPVFAGGSAFAHLIGRGPKASATTATASDETDWKQGEGESDQDFSDRMKKIDDLPDERKQNEDESDSDYSDRMHDKDDDQGDDADDKGDDTDAKKAKRARADDDMDDDEEGDDGSDGAEMKKKSARSARLRERARCAAIFADASAGKNPALAATVAFTTDLPRSQALAVLRAGGLAVAPAAPRKPTLDERMAAVRSPIAGAGDVANPTGVQGLAAQIIAAGTRRRAGG